MKDFRELQVWQRAHSLTLRLYELSRTFPSDERFGLTSQVRRASASIAMNIAEGCGRGSEAELARFVEIAIGSASEVEYQLILARDLGYISAEAFGLCSQEVSEIKRMMWSFVKTRRREKHESS